jgi:hypothetical protein
MDVDPATRETGYRPSGSGLGTIDEEDLPEIDTPPGTPFDSDYPPQQTGDYTSMELHEGVHTENLFTPLYTDSQETDPTNVNNTQPPTTTGTSDQGTTATEATGAAQTEIQTPAAGTVAEEHILGTVPRAPVAETAGTTVKETANEDPATAEASRVRAAQAARLEAEKTAAEKAAKHAAPQTANESAGVVNTNPESAAAAAVVLTEAEAAAAAAQVAFGAHNAMGATGANAEGEHGRGAATLFQTAQGTALPSDMDEWELSEGGLPEGSTLSGSKALMEEYPEDEASSKKTKKPTTGKGKKGKPKPKA